MTFKKDTFVAKYCIAGIIVMAACMLFILGVLLTARVFEYIVLIIPIAGILEIVLLTIVWLENNSALIVTEEGIELKSKIYGTKYIAWTECNLIGIYGYYYGLRANLVFSTEKYICYSPRDCYQYAKRNYKKIIVAGYTPELFAAVEKYAPANLVSNCKFLMTSQK